MSCFFEPTAEGTERNIVKTERTGPRVAQDMDYARCSAMGVKAGRIGVRPVAIAMWRPAATDPRDVSEGAGRGWDVGAAIGRTIDG